MHFLWVQIAVILGYYKIPYFSYGPTQLHSCRARPRDHKVQKCPSFLQVLSDHRLLQVFKNKTSDVKGLGNGFHPHGMFFDMFISEEIGFGACSNDQVIEGEIPDRGVDSFMFRSYGFYFRQAEEAFLTIAGNL